MMETTIGQTYTMESRDEKSIQNFSGKNLWKSRCLENSDGQIILRLILGR